MKSEYTRREFLRQAAMVLPAFHIGFHSPSILKTLAGIDGQTNRIKQLQLFTKITSLEEMRKFYKDVLNLPLVAEDSVSVTFQAGLTQMRFCADSNGGAPFYHFAFNIPENKLEKAIDWMSGRARLLKGRRGNHVVYFDWLDAHSVYFYDPAGNIVEFIAHHPLKNGRPGNFDIEDILYTSEIGLVTDDVPKLSSELDMKLGLTDYATRHHRPVSDVFRPIGDPFGFFIVVKHKRIWLMTEDPAAIHSVTAQIQGRESAKLRFENCVCEILVTE